MTDEQKSEIQGRLELVRAAKQQKAAGGAGVEFAQDTLNGDELTAVLGAEPPPEPAEPGRPAGLTEKQWRLLRAACEVEAEGAGFSLAMPDVVSLFSFLMTSEEIPLSVSFTPCPFTATAS